MQVYNTYYISIPMCIPSSFYCTMFSLLETVISLRRVLVFLPEYAIFKQYDRFKIH